MPSLGRNATVLRFDPNRPRPPKQPMARLMRKLARLSPEYRDAVELYVEALLKLVRNRKRGAR